MNSLSNKLDRSNQNLICTIEVDGERQNSVSTTPSEIGVTLADNADHIDGPTEYENIPHMLSPYAKPFFPRWISPRSEIKRKAQYENHTPSGAKGTHTN